MPTDPLHRARDVSPIAYLLRIVPALVLTTGLGLAAGHRRSHGALLEDIGGACYVLFFVLIGLGLRPRGSVEAICLVTTLLACGVEFLRVVEAAWLDQIRATTVGRRLLGTAFAWSDLPAYFAGGLLAWPVGSWAVASVNQPKTDLTTF